MLFEGGGVSVGNMRVDGREPLTFVHTTTNEMDRRLWAIVAGRPPREPWNLELCGGGTDGFLVDIDVSTDARLDLHVVDTSDGLPDVRPHDPRPQGVFPGQSSDVALVGKRVAL